MDEDLTSCKRVSSRKQVVSCDASCLQEDICGMPTLQGPPSSGSDGVITKKPTSMVRDWCKYKNGLIVPSRGSSGGLALFLNSNSIHVE